MQQDARGHIHLSPHRQATPEEGETTRSTTMMAQGGHLSFQACGYRELPFARAATGTHHQSSLWWLFQSSVTLQFVDYGFDKDEDTLDWLLN